LNSTVAGGISAIRKSMPAVPRKFDRHPVNPRVNNAWNEGAEFIGPFENPA
jgi:hypothetical protein